MAIYRVVCIDGETFYPEADSIRGALFMVEVEESDIICVESVQDMAWDRILRTGIPSYGDTANL